MLFGCGILLCTIPCVIETALYLLRKKKKKRHDIKEVLFFSSENRFCREHFYKDKTCNLPNCTTENVRYLESLIDNCTSSLDVCVYLFTCRRMTDAVVRAKERGATVRVISDYDMALTTNDSGCQIHWLRKYGIDVRTKQQDGLLHHKFVLIDKTILVNGSANWTLQAFGGNWENIIITSVRDFVLAFIDIFESLWEELDPVKLKHTISCENASGNSQH